MHRLVKESMDANTIFLGTRIVVAFLKIINSRYRKEGKYNNEKCGEVSRVLFRDSRES